MREPDESRSLGDLFSDLGRQVSTLVREEINLARVEVTSSVSQLARGAVMTAAGGVVLFAGFLVLLAAVTFALIDAGMDPWLASLIVAAVVLISGGVITWMGVNQIRSTDMAPRQTVETVRENVELVKESMK